MHIIYFIFCFGEWISNCLFRASRGFRQSNLLSLFLFTFVAETFVAHVMKARDLGFILVYEVCNGSLWKITNSKREFVDSTILFHLATFKEFLMLKRFLRCFEVLLFGRSFCPRQLWWGSVVQVVVRLLVCGMTVRWKSSRLNICAFQLVET